MSEDLEKCAKETEAAAELELERQHYLKEYEEETSDIIMGNGDIIKQSAIDYSPGTMAFHETFHASYMIYSMFESHMMTSPAIFKDPELFVETAKARDALWNLYQKLGTKHL